MGPSSRTARLTLNPAGEPNSGRPFFAEGDGKVGAHYRVSADIGGTFTDIVRQDSQTGKCTALKVLSTPENPAIAVLQGIEAAIPDDAEIDLFVHGTTVGLNALLTRRGAKVALLTTENFRDIYTIQGNDRGEIFSIRWNKPAPLVALEDTFTAKERIASTGEVVEPLDTADLDRLVEAARERGYGAIAIAFLFSFKNPEHELAAANYLAERLPGVAIAMSHRVSPEWREFDRTSTTVMDSYLAPVVRTYLKTLVEQFVGPAARRAEPLRHGVQRRHHVSGLGKRNAAADPSVGPGRRRNRRQGTFACHRKTQPDLRGHGRNVVRCQPCDRRPTVLFE